MTDPTTTPAPERGRLAYRDVQATGTPQIASAVPVSVPSPVAGSAVHGDPGGREAASDDIVETAAQAAYRTQYNDDPINDHLAANCWRLMHDDDREEYRLMARAMVAAVTPLIAAQERAKVAEEIAREIEADMDLIEVKDRLIHIHAAARIARRAARPVTGEGNRG